MDRQHQTVLTAIEAAKTAGVPADMLVTLSWVAGVGIGSLHREQIERRKWHETAHKTLDSLLAAYLVAHPTAMPSRMTLMELLTWSHQQSRMVPRV